RRGFAVETDFAFGTRKHAGEHAQKSRLARAVVALDQHGFAGPEAEIQRAEHGLVITRKREPVRRQQRRGRGGRRGHGVQPRIVTAWPRAVHGGALQTSSCNSAGSAPVPRTTPSCPKRRAIASSCV